MKKCVKLQNKNIMMEMSDDSNYQMAQKTMKLGWQFKLLMGL